MSVIQSSAKLRSVASAARRRVTILGSTGSVGCQTIDLIARAPEKYEVVALTAKQNVKKLVEQARLLQPELAVIADDSKYEALKEALADTDISVAAGAEAVVEAAQAE